MRRVMPGSAVLMVRVSASECSPKGYSMAEMADMALASHEAGVGVIHVSNGGMLSTAPRAWPGYQLGYARSIRQKARVPAIGVGRLEAPQLAEFALQEGYCDLVAVGRGMLRDPHWPTRAAEAPGDTPPVPENLLRVFRDFRP
ncbi:MAG: hypothetical protein AB1445_08035 [Bacillota bacterium]